MKLMLAMLMVFALMLNGLPAARAEIAEEELYSVAVMLYSGAEECDIDTALLLSMNRSTGRPMKVTMDAGLFADVDFDPGCDEGIAEMLSAIEQLAGIPVEKYICLDKQSLDSLDAGEGRRMNAGDWIEYGLSLLSSIKTNLPILEAIQMFPTALMQLENGVEIELSKETEDVDQTISAAVQELRAAP